MTQVTPFGLDLVRAEPICSQLTTDEVGDQTALPDLFDQIGGPVSRFIADGATMAGQHVTSSQHALVRSLRSSFYRPRQPFKVGNRQSPHRSATAAWKWKPKAIWLGRNPPAISSAVGSKPIWAGGRLSSDKTQGQELRQSDHRIKDWRRRAHRMTGLGRPELKRVA